MRMKKLKTQLGIASLVLVFTFAVFGFANKSTQSHSSLQESLWVYKASGSKQCDQKSGVSLEGGAGELKNAGVQIIEQKTSGDGKMKIAMCGAPTGDQHYYRITKADLGKAIALGFQQANNFDSN